MVFWAVCWFLLVYLFLSLFGVILVVLGYCGIRLGLVEGAGVRWFGYFGG